jgi:glycosyltransferase involved in cell wall biosynthesis
LRIVFLCEQYPPVIWDGVGVYTHDIAHALAGLGHEVHVLCAQGFRVRDEMHDGVRVYRRPLLRVPVTRYLGRFGPQIAGKDYPRDSLTLRASLAASYALWLARLDLRPDVIETADGETRAFLDAWRHDVPLVVHLHTPTMMDVRMRDGRLRAKGAVADRLDRFSARRADALTSPSDLLVTTLRGFGWLDDREVDVIPYPFDRSPFAEVPPPHHTAATLAVVGRLEWRKGLDILIDAASHLMRRGIEVKVVFAGQSAGQIGALPSGVWLERHAERAGVLCRFEGHVARSELPGVLAESRAVVVPSRFESFSIAGLEGMAAGRPVVATATTGVAAWVDRWGGGAVVPPEKPEALADALEPYLRDPGHAAAVGAKGRAGAAELDPARVAGLREAVYRKAVERHRTRAAGGNARRRRGGEGVRMRAGR